MRFGTININDLTKRQNQVINFVQDNDIDVLFVQEVHLIGKEDVHKIENEVSGITYLNSQSQWTRTAKIIRKNLQNLQINRVENDKIRLQNRLTHIQVITQETLNIISVYCPADDEKDDFFQDLNNYLDTYQGEIRNVTLCNKCPRRPLIMTLIPGCDIEYSKGTRLAQAISCHFVLLFCVTLTLAKNLNFDYDMFTFS